MTEGIIGCPAKNCCQAVTLNGVAAQYVKNPLMAKPGDRVRIYVLNVGPNDTSSFHVVGTIFDRVWLDGNPANLLRGMQTVLLGQAMGPSSNS